MVLHVMRGSSLPQLYWECLVIQRTTSIRGRRRLDGLFITCPEQDCSMWGALSYPVVTFCFARRRWGSGRLSRPFSSHNANVCMINSLSVHTFWICICSWSSCLISVQLLLCSCKSSTWSFLIHFLGPVSGWTGISGTVLHTVGCYS